MLRRRTARVREGLMTTTGTPLEPDRELVLELVRVVNARLPMRTGRLIGSLVTAASVLMHSEMEKRGEALVRGGDAEKVILGLVLEAMRERPSLMSDPALGRLVRQ